MSRGDSLPLRETACGEGHIPSSHQNMLDDLLAMYLLHLTYDCVIFSLDGVVASFIVPEVSIVSE